MPAANYKSVVDAIARRLATVENVGIVHTYLRKITDKDTLKTLGYDRRQGRIAVWFITRESWTDEQSTNLENERHSTYLLKGYYAHHDPRRTEHDFQKLLDDICTVFEPQTSLDSLVELHQPVQARLIAHAEIQGELCHTAELTIDVQEFYTT